MKIQCPKLLKVRRKKIVSIARRQTFFEYHLRNNHKILQQGEKLTMNSKFLTGKKSKRKMK